MTTRRASESRGSTRHTPAVRPRRRRRPVAALAAGVLFLTGLLAAPAQAASAHRQPDQLSVLDITASNDASGEHESYRLNHNVFPAGLFRVQLHNAGTVSHQAQLVRLHTGITPGLYRQQLLATHGGAALALADATGGDASIAPGGFQATYVNLQAGSYVVLCFQQGGDHGAPHFAHGMYAPFQVRGQDEFDHPAHQARGTISAFSMGFHMPAVVRRGGLYRFRNTAPKDSHELQLFRLAPGKTSKDVIAWVRGGLAGRPPVLGEAGGGGALAPGGVQWVRMNLAPGRYVAVCFVPDDEPPHLPHAALGMVQAFLVR